MKRSAFSMFIVLMLSYIVCYFFSLVYTLIFGSNQLILSEFRIIWVLSKSFLLFFVWLPPLHYSVLVFLYSFVYSRSEIFKITVPWQEILSRISQTIVLFLFITAFYVILFETAYPKAYDTIKRTETISSLISLLDKQKEEENNYEKIKKILLLQRSIFPDDDRIESQLRQILSKIEEQSVSPIPVLSNEDENKADSSNKTSTWYTQKALTAAEKKEWASVIYYSQLANTLDSNNREAQILFEMAKDHIYGIHIDTEKDPSYFDRKKNALAVLEAGNHIQAYYQYLALFLESQNDKEVRENLEKSKNAVLNNVFFLSEISYLDAFSSYDSGLIFVLEMANGDNILFVWDKIIPIENFQYVQNIEGIAFSSEGQFLYHMKANYGKVVRNRLLLQGLDERTPEYQEIPVIIRGETPEYSLLQIDLPKAFSSLPNKGFAIQDLQNLTIGQLLKMKPVLSSLGYRYEIVESEILERMIKIFSFLSLSFLSMALGWYSRFRFERFPPSNGFSFFLPLFVYFTYYVYEIYVLLNKALVSFLLLYTGVLITRVSLVFLQFFIILVMVFLYLNLYQLKKRPSV